MVILLLKMSPKQRAEMPSRVLSTKRLRCVFQRGEEKLGAGVRYRLRSGSESSANEATVYIK